MRNKDIPVESGLYAAVSRDGLLLAVGLGPEVHIVAKLKSPIPPEVWAQIVFEEWEDPRDGAFARAAERAGQQFGLEGMIQAAPIQGDFIVLGHTISE